MEFPPKLPILKNLRARLTCKGSLKGYPVWVVEATDSLFITTIPPSRDFPAEGELTVEVFGEKANHFGHLRIQEVLSESVIFDYVGEMVKHPPTERGRAKVKGVKATIFHENTSLICRIVDVTCDGCGIIGPFESKRGEEVDIILHSPFGDICAVLHVKHSAPADFTGAAYRSGGLITVKGRVAISRWNQFSESEIAA